MQVANDDEEHHHVSGNNVHAEGFVVAEDVSPTPTSSNKIEDHEWRVTLLWRITLLSIMVFITVLCIVLLRPDKNRDEGHVNTVDRRGYHSYLLETFSPLTESPQERAIEWLAFQDQPLSGAELTSRLNQRYALVVFYYAHGGLETWHAFNEDSGGWIMNGAGVNECDWKGVDCNRQQQVIGLRLSAREGILLTNGSQLSSEIGLLVHLESLSLADQRLEGTIPSIETLTGLRILDLSNNELGSTIPNFVWELPQLQTLLLGGNKLSGSIPDSLGDSNIERLELQHNIGMEGQMEAILTGMPKLQYLEVSRTSVAGFLPANTVDKLQELHASGSYVMGTIPSEIGTWTSLRALDLGQSQLTGSIPSEFGLVENLEYLTLSHVSMNGTLPTELSQLESLVSLELRVSSLTGSLPAQYARLANLISLDIAYNSGINGTVPREYGNMVSLKNLYLHGTSLSGAIHPDICLLKLIHFTADCTERRVELDCNCCTECFNLP